VAGRLRLHEGRDHSRRLGRSRASAKDAIRRRHREAHAAALDDINGRFGRFTAVPAAQDFKREWKMRAQSRSPAWTTRLDEAPIVIAH